MTAVLIEPSPSAYYENEPVSTTAVAVIPPESPAEDELRSVFQLGKRREGRFIPPKTGYGGYSKWSEVGERYFTSQSMKDFPGAFPDALEDIEQIYEDAREEDLPELPETALQTVHNIVTVYAPSTMWGEVGEISSTSQSEAHRHLLGLFTNRGAEGSPAALADALVDLNEVVEESREEGFPEPSETAVQNAKRLLKQIFYVSNRRYEVYPTPDGEIAIDAPDRAGQSVLLLCESGGGILCLADLKTGHHWKRYSTVEALPDGFVREALAELEWKSR